MMDLAGQSAFKDSLIHTYHTGVIASRVHDPARLMPDYIRSLYAVSEPSAAHIQTLFELKKHPLNDDARAQVSLSPPSH
jgi:hypothetical protein